MDLTTAIIVGTLADLAVGFVIAGAITTAIVVARDAHRAGMARVRRGGRA